MISEIFKLAFCHTFSTLLTKSSRCDSALLVASFPDRVVGSRHFWNDFKRLELVNLLLDRLEEQIPGTLLHQLEQHRSELGWRGHRRDRGQCIDYQAAAADLTIGEDIASALDLVADAGSTLAWEVLELWAPRKQADMERTVKPPFGDLVQTVQRFGKLVPDGYAWHNVLLGSLRGTTRESRTSDDTEEGGFDMNFAINAPSGVLFYQYVESWWHLFFSRMSSPMSQHFWDIETLQHPTSPFFLLPYC
jgi:hypothetical protein